MKVVDLWRFWFEATSYLIEMLSHPVIPVTHYLLYTYSMIRIYKILIVCMGVDLCNNNSGKSGGGGKQSQSGSIFDFHFYL